jgi:PAS domain S-box-containing protein
VLTPIYSAVTPRICDAVWYCVGKVIQPSGSVANTRGSQSQLSLPLLKLNPGSAMSDTAKTGTDFSHLSPQRDGLRLILETALDAVVIMKPDGIVADWNDRAMNVFGWSRDEAVGQIMVDLIIPDRYREAHRNGLQRYLESGQTEVIGRRIEVSGLRKNGEEFPVELSISPIQDRENILFVGFLRDITERRDLRLTRRACARHAENDGGRDGSFHRS